MIGWKIIVNAYSSLFHVNFFFFTFRCEFVEIDEEHVLEIDNPFHLHLANVLVNNSLL